MDIKGIIPIGGRGTRMQPLTYSTNKHFIPLGNKPLIYYPIETIVQAGIKDILITYNPGQLEYAKPILGNGSKFGAKFTYVLQPKPIGLANIFQVCEKYVKNEPFVLHLGDNIFTKGIKKEVDLFLKEKPDGMVTMIKHSQNFRMGVPYFDSKGHLVKYVEKPKKPPHSFAVPGLYFLTKNAFKCFTGKGKIIPSERGEFEIPSVYQWLIDNGFKVNVVEYRGKWLDPGKFDDWIVSNKYVLNNMLSLKKFSGKNSGCKITGKVKIEKGAKITNSEIVGPCFIGNNATIINSRVGPNVSMYQFCDIEKSTVENSILLEGSKVISVDKVIRNTIVGRNAVVRGNNGKDINLFIGDKSEVFF